jgi:hypothetical protein
MTAMRVMRLPPARSYRRHWHVRLVPARRGPEQVQHLRAQTLRPITSSARPSRVGEMSMSNALAVCRLMTGSNLVPAGSPARRSATTEFDASRPAK